MSTNGPCQGEHKKVFVVRDSKRVHVHCDRSHELYDSSATPAATVVAADLAFAAVLAAMLERARFLLSRPRALLEQLWCSEP